MNRISQTQAILIGIVVMGFYYFMVFDPGTTIESNIQTTNQEIVQIKTDIENVKRDIEQAKAYEELARRRGAQFKEWMKYLPRDFTLTDQMKLISKEAQLAKMTVSLNQNTSGLAEKREYFEEQLVDATLKGRFSEFMVFMSNLTRSSGVLGLKTLSMNADSAKNYAEGGASTSPILTINARFVGYKGTGGPKPTK